MREKQLRGLWYYEYIEVVQNHLKRMRKMIEKNLLIDMGVSLPEGTDWDKVNEEITNSIIEIVEKLSGMCGGGVRFEEFDYEKIDAELDETPKIEIPQHLEEEMVVHV